MRFTSSTTILAGLALGTSSLAAPTPIFNSPSPRLGDDVRSPLPPRSPRPETATLSSPASRIAGVRRSNTRLTRPRRADSDSIGVSEVQGALHDNPLLESAGLGILTNPEASIIPIVNLPSDIPSPSEVVALKNDYFPTDHISEGESSNLGSPLPHPFIPPHQLQAIQNVVSASFAEEEQAAMAAAVLTAASSGASVDPEELKERLITLAQAQRPSRDSLGDPIDDLDSLEPSLLTKRDVIPPEVPNTSPVVPSDDDSVCEVPIDVIAVIRRLQDMLESGALDDLLNTLDLSSPTKKEESFSFIDGSIAPSNSPNLVSIPMDHDQPAEDVLDWTPTEMESQEWSGLDDSSLDAPFPEDGNNMEDLDENIV